jgi:hypothetical protein
MSNAAPGVRTTEDVAFLRDLIERHDAIGYAAAVAERRAAAAARTFAGIERSLAPSTHRTFLRDLVGFVTGRRH